MAYADLIGPWYALMEEVQVLKAQVVASVEA